MVGMLTPPPKVLGAPKPISSSRITTTLGAPSGGRSSLIGGNFASRASSGTLPGYLYCVSGIGKRVRSISCADAGTIFVPIARHIAAPRIRNNFFIFDFLTLGAGVTPAQG